MLALFALSALACENWDPLTQLAPLDVPGLVESSGLAPSRRTENLLWTHNDSGTPELFRVGLDGTSTVHAVPAADNADWEDIASAPCGLRDACLYIGDIGSERGDPTELQVYVVAEPRNGDARLLQRWELRWPGEPRDAETLLVHPCTQEAWIVTRGTPTEVFAIASDRGTASTDLLPITSLDLGDVTGGSFSPDGTGVVLRTEEALYHWTVDPSAPTAHWSEPPTLLTEALVDGEAVAWEPDGDLLVTSEGSPTPFGRLACADDIEPLECADTGCGCATGPSPTGFLWWFAAAGWGVARRPSGRSRATPPSSPEPPRSST